MTNTQDFPKVFFEGEAVPTEAVGVECKRENSTGRHPPLNRLHIWWARRPLAASRFAIVGSLVGPDWSPEDVLELLGIPRGKDPIRGRALVDEVISGRRRDRVKDPYGYKRAFLNPIPKSADSRFRTTLEKLWNRTMPVICDPFSGGGSIPFEAMRLGLKVISSEINPVACVVQYSTLIFPLQFGPEFAKEIETAGLSIVEKISKRLKDYFPRQSGEEALCYIWVRSVRCPKCGLDAPLTPNWWLNREGKVCFRAKPGDGNTPEYEIIKAGKNGFDPDERSVAGGVGTCIRCKSVIPEDYIKQEAQAGRMGHQMAAVGYKISGKSGRQFRLPTEEDLKAYEAAKEELARRWDEWERKGLIPTEDIPNGLKTAEPLRFGIRRWCDFFNPRQLLVHLTTLEEILNYDYTKLPEEKQKALRVYLALILDKCLDYNSLQSRLDSTRSYVKNTFDEHNFAFIWSYGEMDGAGQLFRWGVDQIVDAYRGMAKLLQGASGSVDLRIGDARNLSWIPSESVDAIITDPPYYANDMYSELSDFFYVWLKRSIGDLFPEWFSSPLTDKDAEAVANVARFKGLGNKRGNAEELARKDYELKMTQAWEEARRVLKPGGVLTIMFYHKKLEAWDAFAQSIVQTGFTITASHAVSTEGKHSLHTREKQAVQRTIFLVARKLPRAGASWWEDVRRELRQEVRKKLQGIRKAAPNASRIDLLMSAYGEGLRVVSSHWPVRDAKGDSIPLKRALEEARAALQEWYFEDRIGRTPAFDPATKIVLYALEGYGTREANFDDVLNYGRVLGVDVEELYQGHIAERKGSKVLILAPEERIKKTNRIDPEREEYVSVWDKVQAAALQFARVDSKDYRRWLNNRGLLADDAFLDACRFLSREGPEELIETRMARNTVGTPSDFVPKTGQTKLEDH